MRTVIQLLWIGPEPPRPEMCSILRNDSLFVTTTVTSYSELKRLAMHQDRCVAVLARTHPDDGSADAARLIRRQWPEVKILVVSRGTPFTEDALYDDRVAPGAPLEHFFGAVERLAGLGGATDPAH